MPTRSPGQVLNLVTCAVTTRRVLLLAVLSPTFLFYSTFIFPDANYRIMTFRRCNLKCDNVFLILKVTSRTREIGQ